jgi:hypothetical protein
MDTISVADWINVFQDVRISTGTEDLESFFTDYGFGSDLDFFMGLVGFY